MKQLLGISLLTTAMVGGLAAPASATPSNKNFGSNDRYDPHAYTVTKTVDYSNTDFGHYIVYCNAPDEFSTPIPWPAPEDTGSDFALDFDLKKTGPARVTGALFFSSRAGGEGSLEGVLVSWTNRKAGSGKIDITLFCEPD